MTKCCLYKTSDFNKRIVIERFTHGQDADGYDNTTVATYATVWAMIKPLNANEQYIAMQLAHKVSHKIIIRYNATNAAITTTDRIKYGSRYFNIHGIMNIDEDNKYLQINAVESEESST